MTTKGIISSRTELFRTTPTETDQAFLKMNDTVDTFGIYNNPGTPEGAVAADIGSICSDTTNGKIYLKTTDTANTGWVEISTGAAAAGVLKTQEATTSTSAASGVQIPLDGTIPQNSEGTSFLTTVYTPLSASSTLRIEGMGWGTSRTNGMIMTLCDTIIPDCLVAQVAIDVDAAGTHLLDVYISVTIPAVSTAARTYDWRFGKIRAGSATSVLQGDGSGGYFGASNIATLRVTEYGV